MISQESHPLLLSGNKMIKKYIRTPFLAAILLIPQLVGAAESGDTSANNQPPRLLSAFFGLDNALPFAANRLCLGAWRKDGMPVVMSHTLRAETLEPEDFQIIRQSGISTAPNCVTLRPAQDIGENRTVLLIGEFGNTDDDPPAKVVVVGDLMSDVPANTPVNFKGAEVEVIPLKDGPTLIWAEVIPAEIWAQADRLSACPQDTRQVVRVTWTGGISLPTGVPMGDGEGALYRVTMSQVSGARQEVTPISLADLGDRDNNHHLCLDTDIQPISVSFPAGHFVDPNQDLNPDTDVDLMGSAQN